MVKLCKHCNTELVPHAKFCTECGAPRPQKIKRTCNQCGVKQIVRGKFCTECGSRFSEHQTTENARGLTPPPPPPSRNTRHSVHGGALPPPHCMDSVAGKYQSQQRASFSGGTSFSKSQPRKSLSRQSSSSLSSLIDRYGDHPHCDICSAAFEVHKRRHQCACSPIKLLVPFGEQIENAKGYKYSSPQRVCLQCAPILQPLQEDLISKCALANNENRESPPGLIKIPFSNSLAKECVKAADIIGHFFRDESGASKDRGIPIAMLEKAHGLAIMTVMKAGLLFVGKFGTGLVVSKLPDGTWSAPSAIGTVGVGGGFEAGSETVEMMIILGSPAAVQVFHKAQVNLGAGLDIAVGPYGRSAAAAAAVSGSGLNGNYSYSISTGLYVGISLQGSVIKARHDLNEKFYGQEITPNALLSGEIPRPRAAQPLYDAIEKAMHGIQEHKQLRREESIKKAMQPCRICKCTRFVAHTTQIWNKNCKTCDHQH